MPFIPTLPNIQFVFPPAIFNQTSGPFSGVRVLWLKSHSCPCVNTGTPNRDCVACLGRGIYWDPPQGPFDVLITLVSFIGRHIDAGESNDPNYGNIFESKPLLTIPNLTTNNPLWQEVSLYDIIVELDATMRFNNVLRTNDQMDLPAWHAYSLNIAASGAVVVEDPTLNQPVSGVSYSVSGLTVTLDGNYPLGTTYTVEYLSCPSYIIYDKYGGLAHTRPFGEGGLYPRRFRIDLADLYLRDKFGFSTSVT
jgi:hypothetical protein